MTARMFRSFGVLVMMAVGALILAAGCGDVGTAGNPSGVCDSPPQTESDDFPDDEKHWIVFDTNMPSACSDISSPNGSWAGRRLFRALNGPSVEGDISRYCIYTWAAMGDPAASDVSALPAQRAKDRRDVTPQANPAAGWAQGAFLQGVQGVSPAPNGGSPKARVLVWDTEAAPDDPGDSPLQDGTSSHGLAMKALVTAQACPDPTDCAVEVETRIAMPRIRNDKEEAIVNNRGDFGRLSDLTDAIERSLEKWRTELSDPAAPATLVGSLSLAFEGGGDGNIADAAVLKTLRAASCHEVMMFAAAGNYSNDRSGLPYPAYWQQESQPSESDCDDLLGADFMAALRDTYLARPGHINLRRSSANAFLLHAVGGVDHGGRSLTRSRRDACPRVAALGIGWAAPEAGIDQFFTGSSVPTALVASILAARAAQDEFLADHPQTLLDGFVNGARMVPFESQGAGGAFLNCGAQVPWIGAPDSEQSTVQNPQENFPWQFYPGVTVEPWPNTRGANQCSQEALNDGKAVSAAAVIHPQPEIIPCGRGCVLQPPSVDSDNPQLYIEPTVDLTYAALRVDGASAEPIVYDLTEGAEVLQAGKQWVITLDATLLSTEALLAGRATFSALTVSGGTAMSDQVLIVK